MVHEEQKKYVCIREKQIGKHETEITELKVRADYKEQMIEELKDSMHDMDDKLDKITESIDDLKLQSSKDDFNIDNRVKALESKIETLRWVVASAIAILSVFVSILAFVMSHMH